MPEVFTSAVVGAPAREVWTLLRDFASIGDWERFGTAGQAPAR
jgi:hypothetical protein